MGCLKKLINALILVLAIIGFASIGGRDYVMNWWNNMMNPPKDVMLERASQVGDFSKIGEEYEIDKATNALGYKGVLSEHKASGQKLIVVENSRKPLLTPQDFKTKEVDEKLENLAKKMNFQSAAVEEIKVTRRGKMNAYGKKADYVRFQAKVKRLPIKDVEGIISAVETEDGKIKLLVSANESGKYSQLVSNDFFKKIK